MGGGGGGEVTGWATPTVVAKERTATILGRKLAIYQY